MSEAVRKKSPRAPTLPLDEALDRAMRVYEKERRHAAPTDAIAQHMGYKSANNGAALQAMASLRYFGLLERPEEGKMAVTQEVEAFRFAPSDELKNELRLKWLRTPSLFAELLEKYREGLPSDATLRYELIQRGFSPSTAESVVSVFRKSVDFAKHFEWQSRARELLSEPSIPRPAPGSPDTVADPLTIEGDRSGGESDVARLASFDCDRIPVRLSGGRRAWLEIPTPFYAADRKRLKDQIDLILAEDDV